MLIGHPSKHCEVVSVTGMGGIGKTTLARNLYDDRSVFYHFDKRAWVVATQHHNKRQMLESILNSMGYVESGSDEDLALKLYQVLKCQRYLVVIDDVWSAETWDDIKACLPDDRNGSRVLLTTRLAELTKYTCSKDEFAHQMRFLDQNQCWSLFCARASIRGGVEFEKIGQSVVKKCKGLPLAIMVAAGMFSKLNTLDEWKSIAKLFVSTATLEECYLRILSMSYNNLPHSLRACFLYLGVFPEDKVIYTKDIARLWVVEGLIKKVGNMSLDAVANRYIAELGDRNLIIISKLSFCRRKIKAFRMHDLLCSFCVREAQNEKLLHVVEENGYNFPNGKGCRWVSIQSTYFDASTLYSSSIRCRSIFCFFKATSLYLKNFSMLRVFYFTDLSMSKKIVDMVHLRYLPPVVRNFRTLKLIRAWNLVDNERNYLKFPQLRDSSCPPKFVRQVMKSISSLKPSDCTIDLFRKSLHLKRVRITGDRRECNDCIGNLVYLPQLEVLYINGNVSDHRTPDMISINCQIAHLKSIKSLSFRSMNVEWKGINVLSKLPKLEMLMLFFSGKGKEWELPEEVVFSQLFVLEIFSNDLVHWKVGYNNFPKLQLLLLCECSTLREIPLDFEDIPTLKSIELTRCLPSAVMSAEQIEEGQRDYGNENMIVIEEDTMRTGNLGKKEIDSVLNDLQ